MSAPVDELLALVVSGVDYGDADRVIHVLTKSGRAALFAHAARKSRRRFAGALEPFSTITATLSARRRSGMRTIESSVVVESRLPLREDLGKIALASYFVELAARVAPEEQASEELFDLASRALDELLQAPATTVRRRVFELAVIDLLGYRPELGVCAVCGSPGEPVHLDFTRGGRVCARHRGAAREIGPKTLAWLADRFESSGVERPEAWAERAARALEVPVNVFLGELLAPPLASRRLLEDVGI